MIADGDLLPAPLSAPYPVLIAEPLPEAAEAVFRSGFGDVTVLPRPALLQEAPAESSQGKKALVVTVNSTLDASFFSSVSASVEIIGLYSVGHNHVDFAAARARGIAVLNTPDVLSNAVADLALFLILGAARRTIEGIDLLRRGAWRGWSPTLLVGRELSGKTLGIFGMGRIGRAIARRASAFGMTILYRSRTRLPIEQESGVQFVENDRDFLRSSQFVVLAAPSNPQTRKFLNAERISQLPRGAIVINIARGDLVDDDALIEALGSGHVAAAGLDVFNNEPNIDPRYQDLPNVLSLPHMGSSTLDARVAMARSLVDGIRLTRMGKVIPNRLV